VVKLILKSERHFNRNTSNLSFSHIKCLIIDICFAVQCYTDERTRSIRKMFLYLILCLCVFAWLSLKFLCYLVGSVFVIFLVFGVVLLCVYILSSVLWCPSIALRNQESGRSCTCMLGVTSVSLFLRYFYLTIWSSSILIRILSELFFCVYKWCPIRLPHKNHVRFILISSCL
jgi:hypothetical protein